MPREASFVCYIGFAGLDHGWLRLETYKKGALPSLEKLRSCTILAVPGLTTAGSIWRCIERRFAHF